MPLDETQAVKTCLTCGLEYIGSIEEHAQCEAHKAIVKVAREWKSEEARWNDMEVTVKS